MSRDAVELAERSPDRLVLLGVERLVQGDGRERRGPDGSGGVDQESSGETGETVADKVDTDRVHDLVAKVVGVALVEPERHGLGGDDVRRIRVGEGNGGHDRDQHVLLLVEFPGVQAVLSTEELESPVGKDPSEEGSAGVGQKLGDVGTDVHGRVSHEEEGIDERSSSGEDAADDPHSKRKNRHGGVVGRVNVGPDLGIRRVFGRQDRLELHLIDELLVLFGSVDDIGVGEEFVDPRQGLTGKVLIILVDLLDLLDDLPSASGNSTRAQARLSTLREPARLGHSREGSSPD